MVLFSKKFTINRPSLALSCVHLLFSSLINTIVFQNVSAFTVDSGFTPSTDTAVNHIAVQTDDKILIFGNFANVNGTTHNDIARLNADGSLDSSFSTGSGLANGGFHQVQIRPDGKIMIAGSMSSYNATQVSYASRLNSTGTLDTTFDATPSFDGGFFHTSSVVQTDGKVIIGGAFVGLDESLDTLRGEEGLDAFSSPVIRLTTTGSVDATFNASDLSTFGSFVEAMALQPDGKLLAYNAVGTSGGITRSGLLRLNTNGSLDTSFDAGTVNGLRNLVVQADGKALVWGSFTTFNGTARAGMVRLNTDGSVDTTFDPGTGANDVVEVVLVQADGKVLVGGRFTSFNGVTRNRLLRLNSDGGVDTGFDPGMGANDTVRALTLQADGKLLIGGDFTSLDNATHERIARADITSCDTAPATVSPINTSVSSNPVFSWTGISACEGYQLYVRDDTGNVVYKPWYTKAQPNCESDLDCEITPATGLAAGNYTWWVRGRNSATGSGPWSTGDMFNVLGSSSCTTPIASAAPAKTGGTLPTYQWQGQSECTWYQIYTSDSSGNVIYKPWYTAAQTSCDSDTECEITPTTALAAGDHTWWVRGWKTSTGNGPWSTAKTFTVSDGCDTPPTTLMPRGAISDTTPVFTWSGNNACTWYQLWTNDTSGIVYATWYTATQTNCNGDTSCEVTPSGVLGSGEHTWWVRGWSTAIGNGPWSAGTGFSLP